MVTASILLAALTAASAARTSGPQGEAPAAAEVVLAGEHARALWAERALALLGELAAAPEEARARAEARVLAARPSGAESNWYPPLEVLAAATRELTGPLSEGPLDPRRAREQGELQALADALDLVVVPGGFAPRADGLGEPITVLVRCAYRPAGYGEVQLRLDWRSPAGQLQAARSEPATIEALRAGFPMYVRPPVSEPGSWRLVPGLGRAGLAARGDGVRVDCAAGFAQPLAPSGAEAGAARLSSALSNLRESGARSLVALGPLEAFEVLAGRAASGPRPVERAWSAPGQGPRYLWVHASAGPHELALVILCADHEPPDLPLAGVLGERWSGFAQRRGALLLSVNAPAAGADRTTRQVLEAAVAAARARGLPADAPVVAVARGAAAARLAFEPIPGLDLAVLSTVVPAPRPGHVLAGVPCLLVAPGGAEALPGDPPSNREFTWVAGSTVPLLNELELPALVETWLAHL